MGVDKDPSHHRQSLALLGASNLTMLLPHFVSGLRSALPGPIELLTALGPGRSYGLEAGVWKIPFPSLLECGILKRFRQSLGDSDRTGASRFVLLTDVGNDLMYGVSAEELEGWLRQMIEGVLHPSVRLGLTSQPFELLESTSKWRYEILRRAFYPFQRRKREAVLGQLDEVKEMFARFGRAYPIEILDTEPEWYRLDRIHLKRHCRPDATANWLSRLLNRPVSRQDSRRHDFRMVFKALSRTLRSRDRPLDDELRQFQADDQLSVRLF